MELNNIYKINEKGEAIRLGCYYYEAIINTKNELFDNESQDADRYADINFDAFPIIKRNQITKYLRENKSFFIKAVHPAWNDSESLYSWDNKIDLYLSAADIVAEETTETPHENKKGCTEYEKRTVFTLKKPLFIATGLEVKIYKNFEDIPAHLRTKAKSLEDNYKQNCEYWKENKPAILETYKKRLAEGWKLYTIAKSQPVQTCRFVAGFGYVRQEKTNEYKTAEKIKDIINSCVYDSNKLSIYEVLRIIEKLNITIKRSKTHENL